MKVPGGQQEFRAGSEQAAKTAEKRHLSCSAEMSWAFGPPLCMKMAWASVTRLFSTGTSAIFMAGKGQDDGGRLDVGFS